MIASKTIRTAARRILRTRWVWALAVCCLALLGTALCYECTVLLPFLIGEAAWLVSIVLLLSVLLPLYLGVLRCFVRLADGVQEEPAAALYYFSSMEAYRRALEFCLCYGGFLCVLLAACCLPGFAVERLAQNAASWAPALIATVIHRVFQGLARLAWLAGIFAFVRVGITRHMAPFLFVSDDALSPAECLYRAKHMTKSVQSVCLAHLLGVIGWILLSVFVMPLVVTMPLLLTYYAVDCRYLLSLCEPFGVAAGAATAADRV